MMHVYVVFLSYINEGFAFSSNGIIAEPHELLSF